MKQHITCLDGVRGGLALWVFWGHLANAVGFDAPLLRAPALAVDLFMLLSGFLMSWHWESSRTGTLQVPQGARVGDFWLRRFFRIAPLYYPLLVLALLLNPAFVAARDHLMAAFPPVWAEQAPGLSDARMPTLFSGANIAAHLTFIYGLIPRFAANDALPDWSLSLEMQFYLAFPLLMAFCRPTRIVIFSAVSVAVSLAAARLLGTGPAGDGMLANFPQPSPLPLKIHIFAAGIALGWLAANREEKLSRWHYWTAFALPLLVLPKPVILGALIISALILLETRPARILARLLGTAPFRMSGDLSYGVYLVHYLPSYLFLDLAVRHGYLAGLSSGERFLFAAGTLTLPIYFVAYILHRSIERPGIELGRRLSRRVLPRSSPAGLQTASAEPAPAGAPHG
jgi:peptidoglycan/LPS O-acetylase OafA/YrhL